MTQKEQEDHDQRFKNLLVEFFSEFLTLFFPTWAARFELVEVDWLTQEVFPDPPQGERRALDLVCRLRLRSGVEPPFPGGEKGGLVLIHLEVESNDRIVAFRRRFFEYYCDLRRKYDLPVWPIGLFLRVGLQGIGWTTYEEHFWDQQLVQFTFAYVGLPALDAEEYLTGESLLGVALTSLMRVPRERRVELQAESLDRIARSGDNEYRRYLLAECLQTYSDLDPAEWQRLQALLITPKHKEALPMGMSYFDHGRIAGQQAGLLAGQQAGQLLALREMAEYQLETKFGSPLSAPVKQRLDALDLAQLKELVRKLISAQSLKELGLED